MSKSKTGKFGENIIEFSKKVPPNIVTTPLINQLVRVGTGVGSNYCEAGWAETKKGFEHKLGRGKKESKETKQ